MPAVPIPPSGPRSLNIALPAPHPGQIQVIREKKRFNSVCCGRRWGKTVLGRDRLIHPALAGKPTGWFSPTNKILNDTWREMKTVLLPVTSDKSEQEHRIELMGGGVVEMWSLESMDAGRSRKYAAVVVDEAAMAANLAVAWNENIRPTLTDYRGEAWFLSTPRGIGAFKTLFDHGNDPEWPNWMSWQMPTVTNPFISPEEIEEARRGMTEAAFNQEYLALFINWEGSVFRNVEECATAVVLDGPLPGHKYVVGIDWGRSRDYTVFTVIDIDTGEVVFLDRFSQVEYAIQRGRLKAIRDKWKPTLIVAEQNSIGGPIIEQLGIEGIQVKPFETGSASKSVIIDQLALAFERGVIRIPHNPVLIGELVAFSGTMLPGGTMRYAAPIGGNDDTVMSLAIGWTAVVKSNVRFGVLDYMSKHAKEDAESLNKIASSPLTKPKVSAKSVLCPECSSTSICMVGGAYRCNQCGHSWGADNSLTQRPSSRGEYLNKAS